MKNSAIEWTNHTFNPWIGCAKVSDGCKHCYAEAMMEKRWGKVEWGPQGTRVSTSAANWKQPRTWNTKAQRTGVRQRVFCGSLCDVFEDRHDTNAWRISLLELIELTHGLDWLLLTKRPENVVRLIQQAGGRSIGNFFERNPHVWIGTSVEDQKAADERIPHLLRIPTAVRFLSMEPLLGPVSFRDMGSRLLGGIDWIVVGGESGPKARPMHPDWVRSIRNQCQAAGVPFFFKQWGEWWPHDQGRWVSDAELHVAHDVMDADYYKIGKHNAGRLLDGREWSERPQGEATR